MAMIATFMKQLTYTYAKVDIKASIFFDKKFHMCKIRTYFI